MFLALPFLLLGFCALGLAAFMPPVPSNPLSLVLNLVVLLGGLNLIGIAAVSVPTVKRAESEAGIRASERAVAAIRAVLEAAGIIFVEENGEGPGVRLRKERP